MEIALGIAEKKMFRSLECVLLVLLVRMSRLALTFVTETQMVKFKDDVEQMFHECWLWNNLIASSVPLLIVPFDEIT